MSKDYNITTIEAANKLNMNEVTLIKRLDYVDCEIVNGCFSRDFYDTILLQKEETVSLNEIISEQYRVVKGKNIHQSFKDKLSVYAKGFGFWGARYIKHPIFQTETYDQKTIYVYKEDVKKIQDNLKEMILLNNASYVEKFKFIINETCLKDYEETAKLLKAFFDNNELMSSWIIEIGNYFRYILKKGLTEYNNMEMKDMFQKADKDLTGQGRNTLVSFYYYMRENGQCHSDIEVSYNKHRQDSDKSVLPYDFNTYFSIAYMTMNKEYWNNHDMLRKAVEKETNAKVWLYHLMHFICAWRSADIRSKLPRFNLPDAPEEVFNKILNGVYSEQNYITVAEIIGYMFHYDGNKKNKKPEKTEKYENTSLLRLSIPESSKCIFGMLAMLCEAHSQINGKGDSLCDMRQLEFKDCIRLFGNPYSEILNEKAFSNRRANKNYLNMTSEKSEQIGMDGYLLAAYARSHTGGLDKVPEVTSRYLKAKMDGYSADEIVLCLMERGVCSFVPYLLCSTIDKKQFTGKHIKEQTSDIKKMCVSPAEIENVLSIDEKLEQISREKVREIIKWADSDNLEMIARQITECIIDGECYGKNEGVFCLAKACYKGCVQRQRTSCIGCGYEMYIKSVLIELSQEIFRQEDMLNRALTDGEHIKRTMILKERLYPVSYEILSTIKYIYHEDISDYKNILERTGQYVIISDV